MARQRVFVPLRWSDVDAYGHVNNVRILGFLEDARLQLLADQLTSGTGLIVSRQEIEYKSPMLYRPAPIAVDMWVTHTGAADFDMAFELLDATPDGAGDGTVYAVAEVSLVTLDLASQRPRRITPPEQERLRGWWGEPVQWRRRRRRPVTA